ncbi:MAG TPA: DUF4259 domain-containing protein [Acidimicrobiales bacterium]|nr:DUF4259 domain-containing protein [Acidimicrobiales bacterium]
MAVWGTGPFDNDDAADFVDELYERADLAPAREALAATMDSDGWLEAPDGARAVAAAVVVAAGFDGHMADLPDDVVAWLHAHPDAGTLADARLAMDALVRIAGPDSELRDIRLAGPEGPAWVEQVARLGYRLSRVVGDESGG